MDLLDFYRGKISIRKLIMMVRHLPSDSALASRGFAGDNRWGKIEELIAVTADYVHILNYNFLRANGGKNLKEPQYVERPDMTLKI